MLVRGLENLETFQKDLIGLCEFVVLCADLRFAKPQSSLKKVLIVAVRSCGYGVLFRGLRNLGAPCKGRRVYSFCVVQKEPKSTPEVCEPLDSGDDSNRRSMCGCC